MNAYVVKPVKFQSFVEAVQQIGAFWVVINEAPPGTVRRERAGNEYGQRRLASADMLASANISSETSSADPQALHFSGERGSL